MPHRSSTRSYSSSSFTSYVPLRKMFKKKCLSIVTLCAFFTVVIIMFLIPSPPHTDSPILSRTRLDVERKSHRAGQISDANMIALARSIDMKTFQQILNPILVERVVGTRSHDAVKKYIVDALTELKWSIELDTFHDVTPNKGRLLFTNIVATHNADSDRYLVLACHYDSKLFDFKFVAATDSAVPCAMLLYMAKLLDSMLAEIKSRVSLKLVFFDGEEAFVDWTAKDSLYGSRHLANVMNSRMYTTQINDLSRIDLLVLLDLLGAPSPRFYNLYEKSTGWYKLLVSIERRLKALRLIESETGTGPLSPNDRSYYFIDQDFFNARIEDDHIPFLKKNVPVLHLIPVPFPNVWHTTKDDRNAINMRTIKNLLTIIDVFIVQYINGTSLA